MLSEGKTRQRYRVVMTTCVIISTSLILWTWSRRPAKRDDASLNSPAHQIILQKIDPCNHVNKMSESQTSTGNKIFTSSKNVDKSREMPENTFRNITYEPFTGCIAHS